MDPETEGGDGLPDLDETRQLGVSGDGDLASTLAALHAAGLHQPQAEQVVARGGMGVISAVEDPLLERLHARKALHAENADDPVLQAALLREARVMGALEHPGVVPVHGVGIEPDGRLCFTMKLVRGLTLAQKLRQLPADEPLERDTLLDLIDVVVKVCDALAHAHARGVVHCDVKASNVMLAPHGQVYLMDWGVAWVLERGDEPLPSALRRAPSAATGVSVAGSPAYLSPEQARGEAGRIGPRTDVFLVGALVYEILTRRTLHEASSVTAAVDRAGQGPVLPPSARVPGLRVPAELERIVMKALAFEPADRYPDIASLRDDLTRFVRGGAEFPRVALAAGEVLIQEGEPGDAAYLIVSGRCEVSVLEGGQRRVLRVMGPGEAFGETALLSPGPRIATVTALEPTVVEVVSQARFEQALDAMTPWMRRFVLSLAERFRERETAGR